MLRCRCVLALALLLLALAAPVAGQTGSVMPVPRMQFLDNNGNPCSLCKLYAFSAGTTTPLNTYSDVTLMTANPTPIVLNSAGRPSVSGTEVAVYLSATSYKFRLDSAADVPIWTADNVSSTAAGLTGVSNTGNVVFQVDTNNDGTNTFSFLNGTNVEVAQISETGNLQVDGTITAGGGLIGGWTTVTLTATGTQNDYAPGLVGHTILRANNATLLTITGLAAGTDGQHVRILSVGAGAVDLAHQNTGSTTAGDRFINYATSASTSLAAGVGTAEYVYDGTTARWRLINHEQGAPITRTFSAGNFTALTGNWTVEAGDVTTETYYLRGRQVTYSLYVVTSTLSATPTGVAAVLPYTSAKVQGGSVCRYSDSGTLGFVGAESTAAGTTLNASLNSSNFLMQTNTFSLRCIYTYEGT